jgi:hypothetical protein
LLTDKRTRPKINIEWIAVINMSRAGKVMQIFPHLLWIVLISPRNVTIAMGLLICTQLRNLKVKRMLPSIPDKADVVENIDSNLSHNEGFAFHELLVTQLLSLNEIYQR